MIENGRIVRSGMGGFLNPPTHPEHSVSVKTENGGMSLQTAADCEWLSDSLRAQAKKWLDNWESQKPSLDEDKIQDWIHQVLGYFVGCYQGDPSLGDESWYAGKLLINLRSNPMDNVDTHAGVHFIRKFYPDFIPTAAHFAKAKWGSDE